MPFVNNLSFAVITLIAASGFLAEICMAISFRNMVEGNPRESASSSRRISGISWSD